MSINTELHEIKKTKEGYVQSPRQVEYETFGPNSPLPDRIRVFLFIKYRIQDNRRSSESENMTREYIIENTGICPAHFARIIKSLNKDHLIEVEKGKYRDSASTYRLSKRTYLKSVIVSQPKKTNLPIKMPVHNLEEIVDKSKTSVDNFRDQKAINTEMVSKDEVQHQNGESQHQNGFETHVTAVESLVKSLCIPLNSIASFNSIPLKKENLDFNDSGIKKQRTPEEHEKILRLQLKEMLAEQEKIKHEQRA